MDDSAVSVPPGRPGERWTSNRAGGIDRAAGGADRGAGDAAGEAEEEFAQQPHAAVAGQEDEQWREQSRQAGAWRSKFFVFPEDPGVPATNNASERETRPSAVFRKVTGGFRPG